LNSFFDSPLPLRYRTLALADILFERLWWRVEGAANCCVPASRNFFVAKLLIWRFRYPRHSSYEMKLSNRPFTNESRNKIMVRSLYNVQSPFR